MGLFTKFFHARTGPVSMYLYHWFLSWGLNGFQCLDLSLSRLNLCPSVLLLLILANACSASPGMIWMLALILCSAANRTYSLCTLNSLASQGEIPLDLVCDPFNVLLGLVCWCFIEDFCIYLPQGYWSEAFDSVFPWLWCPGNSAGLAKWAPQCSLQCFGRVWEELALVL